MAEDSGESSKAIPTVHALQVADAYSKLRHWLRDCAASAPVEELSAVLARVERYRPADGWPELADARARYKALHKAKAQLAVALQRAPLDALQEAVSHAVLDPDKYHSRAKLALSNSIVGLEAALDRAQSSGLHQLEDTNTAEMRLHILKRLRKDMEDVVKLHASVTSPSLCSTDAAFRSSTAEPSLSKGSQDAAACKDIDCLVKPPRRVPGVAPLLSISTCSADETPVGSPEAALAGLEASSGSIATQLRASAPQPPGELLSTTPTTGSRLGGTTNKLTDEPMLGSTVAVKGLSDQLAQHALPSPPLLPRSLASENLTPNSVRRNSRCRVTRRRGRRGRSGSSRDDDSSRSVVRSVAHWRTSGKYQLSPARCQQSTGSVPEDSSMARLRAEVSALSAAHAGLEREFAEERRASEAAGEQAAAVELLSCLDLAEPDKFQQRRAEIAAAQQASVAKSDQMSSIAWLLLQANGERRSQLRRLELSEQTLRRENEHLRRYSAAQEKRAYGKEMPSESSEAALATDFGQQLKNLTLEGSQDEDHVAMQILKEAELREAAFCQEHKMLEQRSRSLLEEFSEIRLHEQALARENSELRSESKGMQQRVIVAGELARHAQAKAEHAVLEVQQAAAEIVGASPYPSESSLGSRALPALTSSDLEVGNGNAQNTGSGSVLFDPREAVELCSWDTLPGEVCMAGENCIQGESLDASGSFEADPGESLEASGSFEGSGAAASGIGRAAEPLSQESVPIEDFMNECRRLEERMRRFQSWS